MSAHRFVAGIALALGLSLGCAHKQQVKAPVAPPVAARPAPAPEALPPQPIAATPAEEGPLVLAPIYFDFDRSEIKGDDRSILQALGEALLKGTRGVLIEGHCDERGTVEYNIALGDRRANAAREYLVRLGVAPERIRTISYGEAEPADAGHDEQAWAKNRRDEFKLELKKAER